MDSLLEEVLERIATADDHEIQQIMDAVQKRFLTAFPDWEMLYISCPKNNKEEWQKTLDYINRHFCL